MQGDDFIIRRGGGGGIVRRRPGGDDEDPDRNRKRAKLDPNQDPSIIMEREKKLRAIMRMIQRLANNRNISFQEAAIILSNVFGDEIIRTAMRRLGQPYLRRD